jgi:hypothetical protein
VADGVYGGDAPAHAGWPDAAGFHVFQLAQINRLSKQPTRQEGKGREEGRNSDRNLPGLGRKERRVVHVISALN